MLSQSLSPQRTAATALFLSALIALSSASPVPQEDLMDESDSDGSGGKSDAYVNLSSSAQIGIIVSCVVVGVGMLVGIILFYIKKRRQWKREGRRMSMVSVVSMGGVPRRMWDEIRENFKSEKSLKKEAASKQEEAERKWVDVEKQRAKVAAMEEEVAKPQKSWWKK